MLVHYLCAVRSVRAILAPSYPGKQAATRLCWFPRDHIHLWASFRSNFWMFGNLQQSPWAVFTAYHILLVREQVFNMTRFRQTPLFLCIHWRYLCFCSGNQAFCKLSPGLANSLHKLRAFCPILVLESQDTSGNLQLLCEAISAQNSILLLESMR